MNFDYQLHRLGWKSFQHLCGTMLRESMGQTYEVFSDSRDGGRDGSFFGTWTSHKGESLSGSFTIQCKHTSKPNQSLTIRLLEEELSKAYSLAKDGLCDNYILLTNMAISGSTAANIKKRFEEIPRLQNCIVYGREWIEAEIHENDRIRRLVPRLYGLGDLSQILDERAYSQARSILDHLGDDFSKYVTTHALEQGATALDQHGFVLLLGEPCCGKSTIASALALGASDRWNSNLIFCANPEAFRNHWNPKDPSQFFWIDDAFGSTQYERDLALEWNRTFPLLKAAIGMGAKVVFTSRDYIFRAAFDDLKDPSFTLIRDSQVIIQVENLTQSEKEQILYNHIKLGRQPKATKTALKEFLDEIAQHPKFLPETARRLGDPFFTKAISFNREQVLDMVENMREFLTDTLKGMGEDNRAAIAMVFMRGGELSCNLNFSKKEKKTLELLGSNISSVRKSLNSLNSTVLLKINNGDHSSWNFKHPSIRDSFGSLIAEDPSLNEIYLTNTPVKGLLNEITCGRTAIEGVKLEVTPSQFQIVSTRLNELSLSIASERSYVLKFLRDRCSKEFLKFHLKAHPDFISKLKYHSWLSYNSDATLALTLHSHGLLPELERKRFVKNIINLTCQYADGYCFQEPQVRSMLTDIEFKNLIRRLRSCLLGALRREITDARDSCKKDKKDPWSAFYTHSRNIRAFLTYYNSGNTQARLHKAQARIRNLTFKLGPTSRKSRGTENVGHTNEIHSSRSIFDDVDI